MNTNDLRDDIIKLTDTCRYQGSTYEKVTERYARSFGTDRVDQWQEVYLEWSADIAETVAVIREIADDAPNNVAAKLLEAAALFGHGAGTTDRAVALLSEAAAGCQRDRERTRQDQLNVGPTNESDRSLEVRAHREKLFPRGELDDQDTADAIVKLDTEREAGVTDMDILRDLYNESPENCPKSKKCAARIRKARQTGRTSLPKRT